VATLKSEKLQFSLNLSLGFLERERDIPYFISTRIRKMVEEVVLYLATSYLIKLQTNVTSIEI